MTIEMDDVPKGSNQPAPTPMTPSEFDGESLLRRLEAIGESLLRRFEAIQKAVARSPENGQKDRSVSFTTKELVLAVCSIIGLILTWGWWLHSTESAHYQEYVLFKQHIEDTLIARQKEQLDDLSKFVRGAVEEAVKAKAAPAPTTSTTQRGAP